jgi:hypothetical protein
MSGNFFPDNGAFYEINSTIMVQPERLQMTQYGAYALHNG